MKKTLLLTLFLVTCIIQPSFSADPEKPPQNSNSKTSITSLVINANVAIMLINDTNSPINMIGDSFFMKLVTFKQKGNRLIISAIKKWDFRSKGIIYIPAGTIEHIQINSTANVRSSSILQSPNLKISVNGECQINILINGKVEMTGNDLFDINYQARLLSESILKDWKKNAEAAKPAI